MQTERQQLVLVFHVSDTKRESFLTPPLRSSVLEPNLLAENKCYLLYVKVNTQNSILNIIDSYLKSDKFFIIFNSIRF